MITHSKRKFERVELLCSTKESRRKIINWIVKNKYGVTDRRPVFQIMLSKSRKKLNQKKDPLKILKSYYLIIAERPI